MRCSSDKQGMQSTKQTINEWRSEMHSDMNKHISLEKMQISKQLSQTVYRVLPP